MLKKILVLIALMAISTMTAISQSDVWGGGNDENVTVTSSSAYTPPGWSKTAIPENTINGHGLDAPVHEASRFLAHATLGVPPSVIHDVANMNYEDWLDDQFSLSSKPMLTEVEDVFEELIDWYRGLGRDSTELEDYYPSWKEFTYAWFTANMTNDDFLRHRLAFALSEIFVISTETELGNFGYGLASFYDILYLNAFGNFRDILREVTLHPCMGFYLSHLNNPRSIPEENIHPDENYAREVMQLFSIGLYELNPDGSRKLDANGDFIPTYGQDEITEFAKIFTGLGISEIVENDWVDSAYFDLSIYVADMTKPMKMYESWHEPGIKTLLNGMVVPDGQKGMEDIEMAIDNLFNHPNVGPFIGRLLIQRLVKSNPSPAYISRVSAAFDNNGQGVRGDMQAVIKAILLDPEARSCAAVQDEDGARLREPLVRYTQFARSVDRVHIYGRNWNVNYGFWMSTNQTPLGSPSVFNFFLPDYQPSGELSDDGLYGPEFQIHNTKYGVGFINEMNSWVVWGNLFSDWEENHPSVGVDIDMYKQYANDPETLLNELDKIYTHGQLTDHTRNVIKEALEPIIYNGYREDRVRLAIYLLLMSPDYAIMH